MPRKSRRRRRAAKPTEPSKVYTFRDAIITPTGRTVTRSPFLDWPYGLPIDPRSQVIADPYGYIAADYTGIERRALAHMGTLAHELVEEKTAGRADAPMRLRMGTEMWALLQDDVSRVYKPEALGKTDAQLDFYRACFGLERAYARVTSNLALGAPQPEYDEHGFYPDALSPARPSRADLRNSTSPKALLR